MLLKQVTYIQKMVEPKIPANAGLPIDPRLADIAILSKLLLLFSFDDISYIGIGNRNVTAR